METFRVRVLGTEVNGGPKYAQGACARSDGLPVGFILISVIAFWNFVLDWLSFRFRKLARLAEASPLVRCVRNLKREFLSDEALMSKMRE